MRTDQGQPLLDASDCAPADGLHQVCDGLAATLRTAQALVLNRRQVDLAGLDGQVRDLCARALRLSPAAAASLRPRLQNLAVGVDTMLAALAAAAADPTGA